MWGSDSTAVAVQQRKSRQQTPPRSPPPTQRLLHPAPSQYTRHDPQRLIITRKARHTYFQDGRVKVCCVRGSGFGCRLFRQRHSFAARMLIVCSTQARTRRLVKQPPPAQHHESRTMWHWVRCTYGGVCRPLRSASKLLEACANPHLVRRCARSLTVSSVRDSFWPCQAATNTLTDDVPMSRVKFNANTEYAYLQNFKVLQST